VSNKSANVEIEVGTGSVYAQLDLPNPEERLRKARITNVINAVIAHRKLSQKDVAKITGLDQGDISRIEHGRAARYPTDRLLNILAKLGVNVEITQRHDRAGTLLIEVRELSHA
jgi:predicted XRE-type DNA-binding protein